MALPTSPIGRYCPVVLVSCWLLAGACNLEGAGAKPPRAVLYFPTGLALSQDARFLFVANSNFDRRYGWGSLQTYDLDAFEDAFCDEDSAGLDCTVDPEEVLADEVLIGSMARAVVLSTDGTRLFVPSHADGDLTHVDVDEDGQLDCGGSRTCDDRFRESERSGVRGVSFPADPVAIVVAPLDAQPCVQDGCSAEGDAILVAHRSGSLSLFVDSVSEGSRPVLTDVLEGFGADLTGLTYDAIGSQFLITNTTTSTGTPKTLYRVGVYADDPVANSFLYDVGSLPILGVNSGRSTWAVAVPEPAEEPPDGLSAARQRAVVVSQRPDALMTVEFDADGTQAHATSLTEVGNGASRMALGVLEADDGSLTELALVSCFSDRQLYVIDVSNGLLLSIIHGFSGPFEVVLDPSRRRAYVADFRASVVRILDLEPTLSRNPARVLATLGKPRVIEELQ